MSSRQLNERELPFPIRQRRARNARRSRSLRSLRQFAVWAVVLGGLGVFVATELIGALTRA
jgi:hypothetical protein